MHLFSTAKESQYYWFSHLYRKEMKTETRPFIWWWIDGSNSTRAVSQNIVSCQHANQHFWMCQKYLWSLTHDRQFTKFRKTAIKLETKNSFLMYFSQTAQTDLPCQENKEKTFQTWRHIKTESRSMLKANSGLHITCSSINIRPNNWNK